jgi:hypothetical protein
VLSAESPPAAPSRSTNADVHSAPDSVAFSAGPVLGSTAASSDVTHVTLPDASELAARQEATRLLMLRWRMPSLSVHSVASSSSNSSVIPSRASGALLALTRVLMAFVVFCFCFSDRCGQRGSCIHCA